MMLTVPQWARRPVQRLRRRLVDWLIRTSEDSVMAAIGASDKMTDRDLRELSEYYRAVIETRAKRV